MRILLVDQSLDFCAIVAAWLNEFFGAVWVESAASGGAALDAIERQCPELVLATHLMPVLNGIALAAVIKVRPAPPAVVVINAGNDAEFEAQCAAAGADFCAEKRDLQARLLDFLQRRFASAWAEAVAARTLASPRARSIARAATSAALPRFLNRYVTGDQS